MTYELPPRIIYKYADPDTALKILGTKTIKFSNPLDFNDPFDCHQDLIDWELTEKGIIKLVDWKFPGAPRKERRTKIQEFRREKSMIIADTKNAFEEAKEKMGICCFGENFKTLLMWSHYTDKHKGLCIGFSSEPINRVSIVGKVNYSEKIERKNFFDDENNEALKYLVLTKSHFWQYEEEIRAIALEFKGPGEFPPIIVRKVIFGYKSEGSFIQEILDIVRINYPHIDVYSKMELDAESFGLKESSPEKILH